MKKSRELNVANINFSQYFNYHERFTNHYERDINPIPGGVHGGGGEEGVNHATKK